MGNKCHSSSKMRQMKTYLIPPKPTNKEHPTGPAPKPHPLKFIIEIDKIKCKNLTQNDCFVSFDFAGQKQIATMIIANDKNPRWKNKEKFEFLTDTEKIKTSNLTILLKNKAEKALCVLSISMYDIATGPIYHDFSLENKSSSIKGRLGFNLKMRQKVKILIEPIKIQCDLIDLLRETSYNFSFRFIAADGADILHTDHSDVIVNKNSLMGAMEREREHSQSIDEEYSREDFTYEQITEGDKKLKHFQPSSSKNDLKEKKIKSIDNFTVFNANQLKKPSSNLNFKKSEKEIKEADPQLAKHEIVWDYSNDPYVVKPLVEVDIGSNDFSQSCMQFFLWAPKEDDHVFQIKKENISDLKDLLEEDDESEKLQVVKSKLIGECYININKLFKDDIRAVS